MTTREPFLQPTPNRISRNTRDRLVRLERYPTPTIVQIKVLADSQVISVADGVLIFVISEDLNGLSLISCAGFITTESVSGVVTVQLRNVTQAVDMLSTLITIDVGEFTSYTAAAPPVINAANADVATGNLIAVDVDVAGTGAKGLGLVLAFGVPTA